jgi:hypothetical protein
MANSSSIVYQPASLRAAARSVTDRIRAGFQPWVGPDRKQRWARVSGSRIEEAPITPPEGVVLDELAFLNEHQPAGALHWHRLFGMWRSHRHDNGNNAHSHYVGGPSLQAGEIDTP